MTHAAASGKFTAAKAIVGGVIAAAVAGLGTLSVALDDSAVNPQEWVNIAIATLVALGGVFGGVYATTNKAKV